MIFLHGYGSKKESFHYQRNFFCRNFLYVAPDFPCFGGSEGYEKPFSVGDYAIWLEKFLKKINVARAYFVAHSFGARVAFKLFSERAELCEKLVIAGGAGLVKPRSKKYLKRVALYRRVKRLFPRFAERRFGSEEYRRLDPLRRESYKLIVNEDLQNCAKKIACPTLLLYGEDDTVTPYDEEGKTFLDLISASRLVKCRGAHFGFCEFPNEYNELIFDFLRGREN